MVIRNKQGKAVHEQPQAPPRAPTAAIAADIEHKLDRIWIPCVYREVLGRRTRRYSLAADKNQPKVEICHTLLGIELRIGRRRFNCPDLATARYLSIFARLGCESIAVPYDITQISEVADRMESSWQRMMLLIDELAAGRSDQFRRQVRRRLLERAREQLVKAGSGAAFPTFEQSTR